MNSPADNTQFGFDALLAEVETDNGNRVFARETAHLPGTTQEAIPYFRTLIGRNHAAMLAADIEGSHAIHEEARLIARKLDSAGRGILASGDATGYVLARETAAPSGTVPLWEQTGDFVIETSGMTVRIEMEGLFGIGSGWAFWPGFCAHVVAPHKPFLSETGYRSFLGVHADPAPGMTPDAFATMIIDAYVSRELRGKLVSVAERHRP